jgi:hypothetical protein
VDEVALNGETMDVRGELGGVCDISPRSSRVVGASTPRAPSTCHTAVPHGGAAHRPSTARHTTTRVCRTNKPRLPVVETARLVLGGGDREEERAPVGLAFLYRQSRTRVRKPGILRSDRSIRSLSPGTCCSALTRPN